MKSPIFIVKGACAFALFSAELPDARAGLGAAFPYYSPERFAVIDLTPTNFSGETFQNAEPSLAVGTTGNFGKFASHAFEDDLQNPIYSTAGASGSFALPWLRLDGSHDYDYTMDWSSGGTCYSALMPTVSRINVRNSPDPTVGAPFSDIAAGDMTGSLDQPWVRVVNVTNADHIFIGFNDLGGAPGATASVHYSLDGGTTWNTTLIEKLVPGDIQDSPAIRLAISPDGKTVYAVFQRWNSPAPNNDRYGDVVLVRDDNYGGSGFAALGTGTVVAGNVRLPLGSTLGVERILSSCDVAMHPSPYSGQPDRVYVAYTEVAQTIVGTNQPVTIGPAIQVLASSDSGGSFTPAYTIYDASLPELAVASDGTVGLLYLLHNGNNLEVHFLKAFYGNFGDVSDRTLAIFPNNNPVKSYDPYVGDYFMLRTVGADFFGVFSASDDPQPANFPSGVFFQRYVLAGGSVQTNSWLASSGNLVNYNASGGRYNVSPSIDPFMFYDIAPVFRGYTFVLVRYPFFYDPVDPLSPITRMVWPELGAGLPQFKLYTSPTLDAGGSWAPAANTPVTEASGQFEAPLSGSASQAFFRVQQDVSNAQFELFASAGSHGAVEPQGVLAVPGMGTMTFSAAADPGYGVGSWYVDGTLAQSGGAAFTLSNIINEHTLVAAFVASNDLAVTIGDVPAISDPTVTGGTNDYIINIQNQGLSSLTGIVMTNPLPATIAVLSAATSQGTVTNAGGVVSASVGSLDPGASATVDITFTPAVSGAITDTVTVACDQTEADLSNNIATDVTTVLDPVTITNQPASTNVPPGEMASFSVGVSGTPPFQYQWFFNRTNAIADGTNSTLTLTNVTATDAGMYSVFVFQAPGPEDIVEADSNPASLTVGVVGAPAVVSPNNRTSLKLIR